MDAAKKALARTQQFISDHRVALAVTVTAVTTGVIVKKTLGNMEASAMDFLRDKNLLDEFYATFEDKI